MKKNLDDRKDSIENIQENIADDLIGEPDNPKPKDELLAKNHK